MTGGVTPSEVVHRENTVRLHRYEPRGDDRPAPPLVVVCAVVNRPAILDLQPDRSVVGQFVDRGFEVYLVDWGEPSQLDTALSLSDYAGRLLPNCVRAVRERTAADDVHLFGYCTGGTIATVYAARRPGRVRTLSQLAPLLSFDADGGIFRFWGREERYDPARLTAAFGNAPGEWLAAEFSMVEPVEFWASRYVRLLDDLDDPSAVEGFLRRQRWALAPVDVPGGLFTDFIDDLYRENALLSGDLAVCGEAVDVGEIRMPVLGIAGTEDSFIPPAAGRPFFEAVPSDDAEFVAFPAGHVGLSVSRAAHEDLWPRVCDWLAARSDG